MAEFHQRYDLLVTPTLPIVAMGAEEEAPSDPRYRAIKNPVPFTAAFNLTKQPAASVPVGVTADGLPVGVHFAGRYGEEGVLLQLAAEIETAQPWFDRVPPI